MRSHLSHVMGRVGCMNIDLVIFDFCWHHRIRLRLGWINQDRPPCIRLGSVILYLLLALLLFGNSFKPPLFLFGNLRVKRKASGLRRQSFA